MRKAQNVVKFGLNLGAFTALAAALSSCFLVVETGTPTVDSLVAQSTYCDGRISATGASTTVDFKFNAANITIENVQAVMTAVGESGDANLTSPLTSATLEGPNGSTAIATIESSRLSGTGTIRGSANLKMTDFNEFAPGGLSLTNLQPKIRLSNGNLRLWVRVSYSNGKLTDWMKSSNVLTVVNGAGCDPSGI
jgi:hypothetical protein